PQTWNRYAYVTNRPLTSVDALGLDPVSENGHDCLFYGPPNPGTGDAEYDGEGTCPGAGNPSNAFTSGDPFQKFGSPQADALKRYENQVICGINPGTCDTDPNAKVDITVTCAGENIVDFTCLFPDSAITQGGLYYSGWHATAATLGQAGQLAAPGVHFAEYGTLVFFTAESTITNPGGTVTVSRWGRPGLEAGDWVMKGEANYWNYLKSGKWDPGPWNEFAPYNSGQEFTVPSDTLEWPSGWEFIKGILGQRIYVP
ncbi:MAG TPA: hypothetical protein VFA71_02250, partial [Terriglobales bacterium]|nr:hypothetical protein [Terriglobales bacterium]